METTDYVIDLILTVFLIIGVYQFYFWCQRKARTPRDLHLPIDDLIPYWPSWVWVYSFLYYPAILYVNWVTDSHRQFSYIVISYLLLLGLQMVFFLLFPVSTPETWRRWNTRSNVSERFLAFVQRFDARSNSFPSMHTSVAMLTAFHLQSHLGIQVFAFPILIGLSCLFTKQHYVIDIPAGALLGWFAHRVFSFLL